jgi:protocatechuate 3,4-dioxygenase beta subunit
VVRPLEDDFGGGSAVVGRVIDPKGSPVEGASLELRTRVGGRWRGELDEEPLLDEGVGTTAVTDASGRYRLSDVAPGARFVLTARHPSYSPTSYEGRILVRTDTVVELDDLTLGVGVTIKGVVDEPGGGPIPGARIVLTAGHFYGIDIQADHEHVTSTDGRGEFTLKGIPQGSRRVYAWKEGFAQAATDPMDLTDGQVVTDVRLVLQPGVELEGRVVEAGGALVPIEGARIYATPTVARVMARGAGESAADGTFKLGGLTRDTYYITATASGYSRAERTLVTLPSAPLVLEMARNGSVSGRVVDSVSGEPVRIFSVAVKRSADGPLVGVSRFQDVESEEGFFDIDDIEPDLYHVIVRAEGYATARSADFTVVRGALTPEVLVSLEGGSELRGVVVARGTGAPVPRARVTLLAGRTGGSVIFDAFAEKARANRRVETGEDGAYLFEHLPPGQYSVRVDHDGYATATIDDIAVAEGGAGVEAEPVYLSAGGSVAGTVTGSDGGPEAGARVSLSATGFQKTTTTDDEGRYRIDHVPTGTYLVSVVSRGGKPDLGGLFDLEAVEVVVREGDTARADL